VTSAFRIGGKDLARPAWLVIGAGISIGVAAEAVSFGLGNPGRWIPDLIVGWACIGGGLLTASRRRDSRVGLLLVLAGFAWYVGNFSSVTVQPVAIAAVQLTLLHRALLVHAALTLPSGRASTWPQRVAIVGGYVTWSIPATADSAFATGTLSAAVFGVALFDQLTAPAPVRRTRMAALAAVFLLGGTFTVVTVVRAAVPNGDADSLVLLLNESVIVLVVAAITVITLLPQLEAGHVTDLVVRAARTRSGGVREALARALGDPTLEIGYWHRASGVYLDSEGDPVEPPAAHDRRSLTRVDVDGQPAALLVHDPAVLESSALSDAVHTTTILAASNARLRGDVLDQLAEVRASRGRLIAAGDAERRRMARHVDHGPIRRSQALEAILDEVASVAEARGEVGVAEQVRRARAALDHVAEDLGRLAHGLHPASIATVGLAAALRALADRSPLPVVVTHEADDLPHSIQLAIYYACAEAIANAVKHAAASSVSVRVVHRKSHVVLTVMDDGVGGADPSTGTGLRGIADRIESLGGRATVRSAPGVGTGLRAEIPIPASSR
jgi:signal transduction histidine kinase